MIRPTLRVAAALLLSAVTVSPAARAQEGSEYAAKLEQWRAERLERLRGEDGWLTLVGLHWLEPGDNAIGGDSDLPVPLPVGLAPPRVGAFRLQGESVSLRPAPGAEISVNGEAVGGPRPLADDHEGNPDIVGVGRLRMHVIRRGERFAVRVKDPQSPVRTGFTGIDSFDPDPSYRLAAVLRPFDEPKRIEVPTAVGTVETLLAPGLVEFSLDGQKQMLLPLVDEPGETTLWFVFKDGTSGKETYGFRYLYADLAPDGTVDLDFNRAYNPPCAFTPYATCVLPPKENRLALRIEAGEKLYGH